MSSASLLSCYESLGFSEAPFNITPDTDFFYPGGEHLSALSHLEFGLLSGGFTLLTGEVGLGKTLLCRYLLRYRKIESVQVAYILNPLQSLPDLLSSIYYDLTDTEINTRSMSEIDRKLSCALVKLAQNGKRAVVIIDEAQRLSAETLEGLRVISNLETEKEKLISFILVGQPELKKTLLSHALRPLRQRISIYYELKPLKRSQTCAYLHHRLHVCSKDQSPSITNRAATLIHLFSRGVPRVINQIAERVLLYAYSKGETKITSYMVSIACMEVVGKR